MRKTPITMPFIFARARDGSKTTTSVIIMIPARIQNSLSIQELSAVSSPILGFKYTNNPQKIKKILAANPELLFKLLNRPVAKIPTPAIPRNMTIIPVQRQFLSILSTSVLSDWRCKTVTFCGFQQSRYGGHLSANRKSSA